MKSKPEEQNKRATNHPTQHQWHEMNRKQRREITRQIQSEDLSLEVIHPDAGGIDIGNESHYVAVPPGRDNRRTDWLSRPGGNPTTWQYRQAEITNRYGGSDAPPPS